MHQITTHRCQRATKISHLNQTDFTKEDIGNGHMSVENLSSFTKMCIVEMIQ